MEGAQLARIGAGLINRTWLVTTAGNERFILQRLNPVFPAEVHLDIEAVTAELVRRGLCTPRLQRTVGDALYVEHDDEIYRLLTFIDGVTHEALRDARDAREAGALLGRFHRALTDLDHKFVNRRPGVHDTARHLASLRAALEEHSDHPRRARVAPLAESILAAAATLVRLPALPDRVVHGDPKISNVRFAADGTALCLVDLDTLGRMPLSLELGDALRSWCNPAGEDTADGDFDIALFVAAITGYAATGGEGIEEREWRAIVPATATIQIELAARFCADALRESYFGWDPRRFDSRGEHNEVRAAGQLAAARALIRQRQQAHAIVAAAFGGSG
ncbi:MAG: phosphotransferase [Gammaproteobacteria bacterium]|nr:phosphotransferase [Gammaproteobacteria bacterium]